MVGRVDCRMVEDWQGGGADFEVGRYSLEA